FQLDWVATYDEGLEMVTRNDHDIYLVDYHLGSKSGIELLGEAVERGINAPMILMTGQGDPHIDSAATQAGAADYLVKGNLDTALLERAIRYAIARKRGEDKLREAAAQNALLSAALSNSDVGVIITDLAATDYAITFVNAAFERITGYTSAEVMGRNPRFLQDPDTTPTYIPKMRASLSAFEPYQGTILNFRKDGHLFWNEMRISPVKGSQGDVIAWLGFISDVTAKIQAETALRESRENLAAAQRLTHLGSWIVELDDLENLSRNRIAWSDEIYRIFGLEPQSERSSRDLYLSFIHKDDRERAGRALGLALDGEPYDLECRIVRRDSEERIIRVRLEVEHDKNGRPFRALGTIHDITEH
ncbi:PAS domain S-box protein, partial [bacterium]